MNKTINVYIRTFRQLNLIYTKTVRKFWPIMKIKYLLDTFIVVMMRVLLGSGSSVRLIVRSFRFIRRPWIESHVPACYEQIGAWRRKDQPVITRL